MLAQIKTWGNSQAVRLPREILKEADLNINDEVDIKVQNGIIMLSKIRRHRSLEERAAEYGGMLNLNGEFDWGEEVGQEVWT